jgi:hypothetical protein
MARKRRKALRRLKSFREPPMLVFGTESTGVIVAEANTVSKDPCLKYCPMGQNSNPNVGSKKHGTIGTSSCRGWFFYEVAAL